MKLQRSDIPPMVAALRTFKGVLDGKARYAIGKNLVLLNRKATEIEEFRIRTIRELSPEKGAVEVGTPEHKVFFDTFVTYANGEDDIHGLVQFTLESLDMEHNPSITTGAVNDVSKLIRDQTASEVATDLTVDFNKIDLGNTQ
jgi:hypothetical protein